MPKRSTPIRDTLTQPLKVPFSENAMQQPGHGVNATRIVEALIIAFLTSVSIYITTVPKLEERIASVQTQQKEMQDEIKKMRDDFYTPRIQNLPPMTKGN